MKQLKHLVKTRSSLWEQLQKTHADLIVSGPPNDRPLDRHGFFLVGQPDPEFETRAT
jgi:hypothetical protein